MPAWSRVACWAPFIQQPTFHGNFTSFGCIAAGALYASSPALRHACLKAAHTLPWLAVIALLMLGYRAAPAVTNALMPVAVVYIIFAGSALGWVRALLESAPLQLIGLGSYSLYLWQQLFLAKPALYHGVPLPVVLLPVTVIASVVLVERPFIRLGRRWSGAIDQRRDSERRTGAGFLTCVFVVLALVLISLPVFMSLLRQYPQRRFWAVGALGFMLFLGDTLRIDTSIISWPMWNGIVRGVLVSPIDSLALALLLTRRGTLAARPFWIVFGLYGAMLTLSMLFASVAMASGFAVWQFLRIVLLFAAIAGECGRPDARSGLLSGLSLGLILQVAYVVPQKLSGTIQATGTMFHQNALGMLVELALLPMVAALLAGDRSKLLKIGIASGLLVIAGGGSRGAMAFAGGGLAVLALASLIRGTTPVKLKMVGLGALALVLVVPLGFATLKDRFGSGSIVAQEGQRIAFERAATAMANDHPMGVGANLFVPTANTKGYAARAGVAWNKVNRSAPVHNAYLLARAETGWAGQIAFTLLLIVPIVIGLRAAFADRKSTAGEIALGAGLAVGVNLIHNSYEYVVFTYHVMALLFVVMGLVASQANVVAARSCRRPAAPAGPGSGACRRASALT